MKFGKSLSNQIEKTLPQWRDKFLSYKELKKKLKLVEAAPKSSEERPAKRARLDADMSVEEIDFRNSLEQELHKFNTFFEEKEEECIIKLKVLEFSFSYFSHCVDTTSLNSFQIVYCEICFFFFFCKIYRMILIENYLKLNC